MNGRKEGRKDSRERKREGEDDFRWMGMGRGGEGGGEEVKKSYVPVLRGNRVMVFHSRETLTKKPASPSPTLLTGSVEDGQHNFMRENDRNDPMNFDSIYILNFKFF